MTMLFIAEPTGRCQLALRRFRHSGNDDHWHNATVVIDEDAAARRDLPDDLISHDDPRWPAACQCGEPFAADDQWQVNDRPWYEGDGHRFAWGIGSWDGPPGAMIRAEWRDIAGRPDAWMVFLPNGSLWCTNDRAAGSGSFWQVTGTAPHLTVSPSIDDRDPVRPWHGWIKERKFR